MRSAGGGGAKGSGCGIRIWQRLSVSDSNKRWPMKEQLSTSHGAAPFSCKVHDSTLLRLP